MIIGDVEPEGSREEAVKALLKAAFRSPDRVPINSPASSVTGLQLHDRFVSHLEVLHLVRCPPLSPRQWLIVLLYYRDDMTNAEVSAQLGIHRDTVVHEKLAAIELMIRIIWQEPAYRSVRRRVATARDS